LTTYVYEYDKVVLELDGGGNANRNVYGLNLLMRTVGKIATTICTMDMLT